MTRREIFLQVDPYAIHDMIGFVEIDWNGTLERFRSERPFDVCQGLKWFASGIKHDVPKDIVIAQIISQNSKFEFPEWQLDAIYKNREGTLGAAIEALGLLNLPKVDDNINQWLDQTIPYGNGTDINFIAADIISNLINGQKH